MTVKDLQQWLTPKESYRILPALQYRALLPTWKCNMQLFNFTEEDLIKGIKHYLTSNASKTTLTYKSMQKLLYALTGIEEIDSIKDTYTKKVRTIDASSSICSTFIVHISEAPLRVRDLSSLFSRLRFKGYLTRSHALDDEYRNSYVYSIPELATALQTFISTSKRLTPRVETAKSVLDTLKKSKYIKGDKTFMK